MNLSITIINRLRNSTFWPGRGIWYVMVLVFSSFFACNTKNEDKLTIAAAANVQFAIDTLAALFETETGIKTSIITGSSGKLTAQILQGAPYDIFLSADMKYPEMIYTNGKALGAPVVYAYGSLILWTQKDDISPDPATLPSEQIKRIAIANPRTAPYGIASVEFLKSLNLFDKVKDKLIFGESISQVNQFIASKSADIGFSAESVVLATELSEKGKWTRLDDGEYAPIEQGLIIVNRKNVKKEEAERFFEFILSYQAKQVLSEFGYKTQFLDE
jgi:molybdate transport system substrate-binding protein